MIYNDEGIIRPMRRKSDPHLDTDAIMAMVPSDLNYLVRLSQAKKLPHSGMDSYHLYRSRDEEGTAITLAGPFLGAPQSVIGMEKMIALGSKRIWVLGYCGSLQERLGIGSLIIPTGAFSEEGTSQHYPIGEKILATDEGLNRIMEKTLRAEGHYFECGKVWTTDAPFRETPAKVKKIQAMGLLAVEMEMSALMTVAIYRGINLAGLLVVSDELFHMKWKPGFSSHELKNASRVAADLLYHLIKSIHQ